MYLSGIISLFQWRKKSLKKFRFASLRIPTLTSVIPVQCSGIAEVRVGILASLNFFRLSFHNCKSCDFNHAQGSSLHLFLHPTVQTYKVHIFIFRCHALMPVNLLDFSRLLVFYFYLCSPLQFNFPQFKVIITHCTHLIFLLLAKSLQLILEIIATYRLVS